MKTCLAMHRLALFILLAFVIRHAAHAAPLTVPALTGATALALSSADTTAATVDLNGAQFVTFDGRPGGAGTAKELTLENTSAV